jgi:hypothetical protein
MPGYMGLGGVAASAPQPAPAVSNEPVIDSEPDEIMGNGHIVQPAVPEGVDTPRLTAGSQQPAATAATIAMPGSPVAAQVATPADAAAPKPAVHAMIVKASPQSDPSLVGSASWIAHVLAALGGAITAGAVAWFLIGPTARRTYG